RKRRRLGSFAESSKSMRPSGLVTRMPSPAPRRNDAADRRRPETTANGVAAATERNSRRVQSPLGISGIEKLNAKPPRLYRTIRPEHRPWIALSWRDIHGAKLGERRRLVFGQHDPRALRARERKGARGTPGQPRRVAGHVRHRCRATDG